MNDPAVNDPAVTILVVGPRRAGVSSLVAALRQRMRERVIVELGEGESGEPPAAVVFVVSSVAPVAQSDCDLIEQACGHADLVIGAAAKIDAHRRWREVMAIDRALLAERGTRYAEVPWVGVAAAPEIGEPNIGDLEAVLAARLTDPGLATRSRLRVRDASARSPGTGATARAGVQEARVRLTFLVRKRCAALLAELRRSGREMPRGGAALFEERVRKSAERFVDELDAEISREVGAVAAKLALRPPGIAPRPPVEISDPRLTSDRLQFRLTAVLGGGFGAGVALAASRLLAGAVPGFDALGFVAGGLGGLLAALWVIGARGLLNQRAMLDGWLGEVAAALRAAGEEMVSSRLLAAEISFAAQIAAPRRQWRQLKQRSPRF